MYPVELPVVLPETLNVKVYFPAPTKLPVTALPLAENSSPV
jgi:hypothetical protein